MKTTKNDGPKHKMKTRNLQDSLKALANDLREFAGIEAEYLGVPKGYRQECVRINGVSFFWNSNNSYDGWELDIAQRWWEEIKGIGEGKEPSEEFLTFLKSNPGTRNAIKVLLGATIHKFG